MCLKRPKQTFKRPDDERVFTSVDRGSLFRRHSFRNRKETNFSRRDIRQLVNIYSLVVSISKENLYMKLLTTLHQFDELACQNHVSIDFYILPKSQPNTQRDVTASCPSSSELNRVPVFKILNYHVSDKFMTNLCRPWKLLTTSQGHLHFGSCQLQTRNYPSI